jgi:hypothetical protein
VPSAALSEFLAACRAGTLAWEVRPGAASFDLANLQSRLPGAPVDYVAFLSEADGGEGDLVTEAPITYLRLWSAASSIDNNDSYQVQRSLPGYWGIGDNGGGEMLAFDRSFAVWPLYAIPFIPMDARDRIPVADSFGQMLRRLGKSAIR